jgi:hypothetical protein
MKGQLSEGVLPGLLRDLYVGRQTGTLRCARNDERLYELLSATPTTFVSVSHHDSIQKYHHSVLELFGDGTWQLHPVRHYCAAG